MAAVHSLVHETTTSTGTGNLTTTNANGKRSFNTAFGTGGTDVFYYFVTHQSAAEYEWGTGHLSAATTLVRDTVIGSSNSNAAVSFSAGTKDITCDIPAANQIINPLTTRGDLMRRGASGIERFGLGSLGQKVFSDGTDAFWKGGLHQIGSATPSGVATSSIVSIPPNFSSLLIYIQGISSDTAARFPRLWPGVGGVYDKTSANFPRTASATSAAGFLVDGTNSNTAAQVTNAIIRVTGYQNGWSIVDLIGGNALTSGVTTGWSPSSNPTQVFYTGLAPGNAIDCFQLDWNSTGNFDAGSWSIWGSV